MINHARTLLLNVLGATGQRFEIGEEYIPPSYSPRPLPTYLQTIHRVLFGTEPDSYFLSFRARELMQLLHETELSEYVYALDPRVTYWPETDAPFLGSGSKISIARIGGDGGSGLFVTGVPAADNGHGKSLREYTVTVNGNFADIALTTSGETVRAALDTSDGISQPIALPRSQLRVQITTPFSGESWSVTTLARPAPAVTTLLPMFELLGEPVFLELFGAVPAEPYATFKNLWFDHPNPVYRIGGLVLATIYRTNSL